MDSVKQIVETLSQAPRFDDQIIAVTGASQGIGRALALLLAARGATIVLIASHEERLNQVYDEIVEAGGQTPLIVPVDFKGLTSAGAHELADYLSDTFDRLDGLVHMAGILGGREPIQTHRPSQWEDTLQINLTAVFHLTQALLPLLNRAESGRVVFATSSVGYRVEAYWGAYAVSKAGLEMFAGILAKELENTETTRVVTINPGGTRTQMRAQAKPAENPNTLPSPDQVAEVFSFGLTPQADSFHGQRINARDVMAALGTWPASDSTR
jgi:Dehydrogenases with different specificities (related to short-chain alcohol dehydrogenases)